MAKKQEASAKKSKPAPRTKAKATMFDGVDAPAAAAPTARKKSAAATGTAQEMSNEAIGAAAGLVWQALANDGSLTLAAIKKAVDAPADHVLLALGWLAREDKLAFEASGRTVSVSLR